MAKRGQKKATGGLVKKADSSKPGGYVFELDIGRLEQLFKEANTPLIDDYYGEKPKEVEMGRDGTKGMGALGSPAPGAADLTGTTTSLDDLIKTVMGPKPEETPEQIKEKSLEKFAEAWEQHSANPEFIKYFAKQYETTMTPAHKEIVHEFFGGKNKKAGEEQVQELLGNRPKTTVEILQEKCKENVFLTAVLASPDGNEVFEGLKLGGKKYVLFKDGEELWAPDEKEVPLFYDPNDSGSGGSGGGSGSGGGFDEAVKRAQAEAAAKALKALQDAPTGKKGLRYAPNTHVWAMLRAPGLPAVDFRYQIPETGGIYSGMYVSTLARLPEVEFGSIVSTEFFKPMSEELQDSMRERLADKKQTITLITHDQKKNGPVMATYR